MSGMVCVRCGAVNEVQEKPAAKPRSTPQHRRMFALFDGAWFHWQEAPDDHDFKPKSRNHLRYYLEMRAGHFDVLMNVRVTSMDPDKVAAVFSEALRRSRDEFMFVELDDNLLTIKQVKSISYDELSHKEACKLFDDIGEILAAEGLPPEKVLRPAA